MILIDTSAWIEFLRDTGTPVCERVDLLLAEDFAACAPVRMEVLAGAGNDEHLQDLRGLLARPTSSRPRQVTMNMLRPCTVCAGATAKRCAS